MKRRTVVLLIIAVVLFVIGGSMLVWLPPKEQIDVGQFTLATYQWEIENFPSDKKVVKGLVLFILISVDIYSVSIYKPLYCRL